MKFLIISLFIIQWVFMQKGLCENPAISQINLDGSFQFGNKNNNHEAHFHQAMVNPLIKVRGKYGNRNPSNEHLDETVHTAGPRGARWPNIHRKQSLSQFSEEPINSPLSDPDDPSYSFDFKTMQYSRMEESDSSGRVQGEFIYVDDAGEKHGVRYKASASSGFEVENGVPDSPSNIRYNTPLYKAEPTARGRITFERGPDRQYKFLTSSPDQRRSEITGPDNITRGSYSYLDDKGVQRTVQYVAGAGIGYKVVQSTVGPGTHVSANFEVQEHSIKSGPNAISGANNEGSYPTGPGYIGSTVQPYHQSVELSSKPYPPSAFSADYPFLSSPRPFSRPGHERVSSSTPSYSNLGGTDRNYKSFPSGGPSPLSPSELSGPGKVDLVFGLLPPKEETWTPAATPSDPADVLITPSAHYPSPTPTYLPTGEAHSLKNQISYDGWFPFYGQRDTNRSALRAHIQNIDLISSHDRALSPSEALRLDEEREDGRFQRKLQPLV